MTNITDPYNTSPSDFNRSCIKKLLAVLNQMPEIKDADRAIVIDDRTVDIRIAFNDSVKLRAEISEKMVVDDEDYSWVRFVDYDDLLGNWIVAFKRSGALNKMHVEESSEQRSPDQASSDY